MSTSITTEAVIFLGQHGIVKEMLFPEFEAVLDHVVALTDFKGQAVQSVYLRINGRLKIVAAVCFLTEFDAEGFTSRSWNLPLSHLADTGSRGPDLGAGPIKLSCRSHCSVSWHHRNLWDPDLNPGSGTFARLSALVAKNRLGLAVDEEPLEPPMLSAGAHQLPNVDHLVAQQLEQKTALLADQYQLKAANLKAEANEQLARVQRHYRAELAELQQRLAEAEVRSADADSKAQRYYAELKAQAEAAKQTRREFEQELAQAENIGQASLDQLRASIEEQFQFEHEQVLGELRERLEMRDVELFYRDEQISALREELSQLRSEKQKLTQAAGDRLLSQLVEEGVSFVAYRPGTDQLAIPLADIGDFLEAPKLYCAEQCGVDLELYEEWLRHHELPVCMMENANGELCGKPVPRVEKPLRFIPGESDRCVEHGTASSTLSGLIAKRTTE